MGVSGRNKPLRNILALIAVHLLLLPRLCQEIQEQPIEQPAEDKKQLIDLSSSTVDASHRVGSNPPDGRLEASSGLVTDDVKQATLDHHGSGLGSIGQAVITRQGSTEHGTTLQDLPGHDLELRLPLAQHLTPGLQETLDVLGSDPNLTTPVSSRDAAVLTGSDAAVMPAELIAPDAIVPPVTVPALPAGEGEGEGEERHSFALARDGAKIVAANREARKPESILDSDSDTFLRNDCRADKWVLLELSQVAKVDALQLSQWELYSSRVRDFEVLGRQNHPRTDGGDYAKSLNASSWQLLGRFTAANTKGTQAFTVEQPRWAKYLQLRFLTHYGSEPVCALNDVHIFGKSAVEDLEDRLAASDEPDLAEQLPPVPLDQPALPAAAAPLPAEQQADQASVAESDSVAELAGEAPVEDGGGSKQAQAGSDAVHLQPPEADGELASQAHAVQAPAERTGDMVAEQSGSGDEVHASIGKVDGGAKVREDAAVEEHGSSGAKFGALPPVLEVLGEGLKRLIAPPGGGKKRAAYTGSLTNRAEVVAPAGEDGSGSAQSEGTEALRGVPAPIEGHSGSEEFVAADVERKLQGSTTALATGEQAGAIGVDAASDGLAAHGTAAEGSEMQRPAMERDARLQDGSREATQATAGSPEQLVPEKAMPEKAPLPEQEALLAANSASSAKARHGGSIYDLLVAEIKALKLQQKMVPRALADVQRNVTSAIASLAAELAAFHSRLNELEAAAEAHDAVCLAELAGVEPAGGNGSVAVGALGVAAPQQQQLSQQQQEQQRGEGDAGGNADDEQGPVQALAVEVAALRAAVERGSKREFAMVMLAVALCALWCLSSSRLGCRNPLFRGAVLCLALGNGLIGLLLHCANTLGPDKVPFAANLQRFVGI